jgi:hypothetical protein
MKCLCSIDGNGGSAGSANGAMSIERDGAMSTGVGLPTPGANIGEALSVAYAPSIMNFSRIPIDEVFLAAPAWQRFVESTVDF